MIYNIFFLLLCGHALCDYSLQNDTMAKCKDHITNPMEKHVPWYYWLGAHSLIHGGMVTLITGSTVLGLFEAVTHAGFDYMKCDGATNIHQDQALHLIVLAAIAFCWAA